jgi:hypothetical protein
VHHHSINDADGKFAAGVNNTGGINYTGGK